MAKIDSIEKNKTIVIKPIRYENRGEEWVICEIQFSVDDKKIFQTIESVLQDYELESLATNLENILDNKTLNYNSDFIEPNFEIKFNRSSSSEDIKVFADFARGDDYNNRKNETNYYKAIDFFADKTSLKLFIRELEVELKNLREI
jgi:hypothetical protein